MCVCVNSFPTATLYSKLLLKAENYTLILHNPKTAALSQFNTQTNVLTENYVVCISSLVVEKVGFEGMFSFVFMLSKWT